MSAELGKVDWSKMQELAESCPSAALSELHEKVLEVLENLVPAKKKKLKSRPKMNRMRRLLWRKLAKARKRFKSAKSIHNFSEILQQMWELEKQLSADYMATNNMEEDEAVFRIKSNTKTFFSFARSRQKVKAKVGPFLDPLSGNPNPSPDFAAEALRQQYNSVFATPRPDWLVHNYEEHFRCEDGDGSLSDFEFSQADIEKACSELKSSAAPGPDGVPAILLKSCRKQLSRPLYLLWRATLDLVRLSN